MNLVERAVELLRGPFESDGLSMTLDQAAEVLRKEKAEPAFPKGLARTPDYSDILPDELCQCPDCRRARGETVEPSADPDFDEEDLLDEIEVPPDMPPEIARILFEETAKAVRQGESLDELISRLMGGGRGGKRKKGRRR